MRMKNVCLLLAGLAGACCLLPMPAQAWWRGGVFIGVPPVVVGPPAYYYPPPVYYPPPAPYYAVPPAYTPVPQDQQAPPAPRQQSQASVPYGSTCYAGFYVCAAPASTQVGSGCSCPGIGAPSYGTVN